MDLCLEREDLSQLTTDGGRIRRVNTHHRGYCQEGGNCCDHCYDDIIVVTVFESIANMDGGGGGGG